jgi:hypothetical protein
LIGWGTITSLVMSNTLIQMTVPDSLRGRVISTYFWAQSGAAPFGSLFIGWLTQAGGAPLAAGLGAAICLGSSILIHAAKPIVLRATGEECN